VRRDDEGLYIVKLPTRKDKLNNLGESRDVALKRFLSMEKRLITQPSVYEEYKKFMQEYINLNHIREVNIHPTTSPSTQSFYLPHHAVRKRAPPRNSG